MEQVSVVIVNWNTGKLLAQCLESISALSEQSLIRHVVVVDNASADTSCTQAQPIADQHAYTILAQHENLGFAKANNKGITYIREHGGQDDHILLLNPDTRVHAGAIPAMLSVFTKDSRAGIVGPKLLEKDGSVQPSVRSFPTLPIFLLLFLKLHRLFHASSIWSRYMMASFDYEKEQQVDQVMGAAFLIRNTVMQQLGKLDESFWIWFEEVDFCKRAHNAGYHVVYTPGGSITHMQGTSFNQLVGIRKTKPFLNSSLVYARKHLGTAAYLLLCVLYPLGIVISLFASVAHKGQQQRNEDLL